MCDWDCRGRFRLHGMRYGPYLIHQGLLDIAHWNAYDSLSIVRWWPGDWTVITRHWLVVVDGPYINVQRQVDIVSSTVWDSRSIARL